MRQYLPLDKQPLAPLSELLVNHGELLIQGQAKGRLRPLNGTILS